MATCVPAACPTGYPQFFARGEGCHIWDVDGRKYLDFMCSWGPIVLGHRHPAVDAAARRQLEQGDCLNGPPNAMVELAERLVGMVTHADWAMFSKNGTDATTTCVTLARGATGQAQGAAGQRRLSRCGALVHAVSAGVMPEDRAHILYFDYNDVASLEAAVDRAGDDLAGDRRLGVPARLRPATRSCPTRRSPRRARALCDAQRRRADPRRRPRRLPADARTAAGSRSACSPTCRAWSKAIANGYALAAVMGNDRFRDAAAQLYATGSFWCGAASMAAALATIDVLQAENGPEHMRRMGQRLRDGIAEQARRYNLDVRQSGPPQMPTILFEDDADYARGSRFVQEALSRGVYMHPKHNMFLSLAHTAADIDFALSVTDEAFKIVARL